MFESTFDIIVVGAGHAGCEAANAAATMGSKVLLITMDMTKMGQMSCNPAMGGIAKGQIVREIDALGGMSGIITDLSMVQFRMLNRSKGPAVWSPRAQCDRSLFSLEWRYALENTKNIYFWQDFVTSLLIEKNRVTGVNTKLGVTFKSSLVIITNGTFEKGLIHVGKKSFSGGRISELPSIGISDQLNSLGFVVGRMKTGTPARLDGRYINFEILEEQKGDSEISGFSFLETYFPEKQLSCYITHTNFNTHEILREGFRDSPLLDGTIQGIGPRYCPSIEDKIVTFVNKASHQLFLEPEGWRTNEYYINGFSSSLPLKIQYDALRSIRGLEKIEIFRPGYAIEYDYYPPTQLKATLESKMLENLFFAGQVNGTTGYEEAAAQGLIAGINAHLKLREREHFILKRNEAYIGVLIDDLINKGVDEPYRMFTSRAEYRILLRQDNADERLTEKSYLIGLAGEIRMERLQTKNLTRDKIKREILEKRVQPADINPFLASIDSSRVDRKIKLFDLVRRPEIILKDLLEFALSSESIETREVLKEKDIIESLEIELKYFGYIKREKEIAEKINRLENHIIAESINYDKLLSISTEARQKLMKVRPKTIGQARRISGVSPSDINILLLHLGR